MATSNDDHKDRSNQQLSSKANSLLGRNTWTQELDKGFVKLNTKEGTETSQSYASSQFVIEK